MSFIPVVTPPPPSPRAQELARRVSDLVRQARLEQPGINDTDVRQALQLVAAESGRSQLIVTKLVLVGIALLGLFLVLYLRQG